jgi:hypothetical protein
MSTSNAPAATDTIRALAKEAYIFAFPMLEGYKTMYFMSVAKGTPAFRMEIDHYYRGDKLATDADKDVVRVNNDTLYLLSWLDLRTEPRVIEVPVTDDRYFVVQLVDMFTYNYGYIGTRTTGDAGGRYMIAGPAWNGAVPGGIDKVFAANSDYVFALGRVAVNGPADLANGVALEAEFRIIPLSEFAGTPAPPARAATLLPFDPRREASVDFIGYLNFLLTLVEPYPGDEKNLARWSAIGIGAGMPFDASKLSAEQRSSIEAGINDAVAAISDRAKHLGKVKNNWTMTAGIFGDRDTIGEDYLLRAAAAQYAIYGNDLHEAFYPSTESDANGNPLDAAKHDYALTFSKAQLPPVNAFWSVTMYDMPAQLLVANEANRYSVGNRTPGLVYGSDGSLTIPISAKKPSGANAPNWLPAPNGPFTLTTRLYMPKPEALDPLYAPPPVEVAN